jgi:hypothetical protein
MAEITFHSWHSASVVPNGAAAKIHAPFRIQLDASASSYRAINNPLCDIMVD